MPDLAVRAIWLGGLALVAVGVGLLATRVRRSSQPAVRLDDLGFESAIVAFTSTDCSNCKKVMRLLSEFEVPVREVAYELEPGLFETAGVEGVPPVVVVGKDGSPARQFGGMVSRFRLRIALARAGW
jgi:hypothetical protein